MISPNIIIMYDGTHASIPSGFTRETSLDGKFPKGTDNATNPNTTGGNSSHSHTSPTHTHTLVAHGHYIEMNEDDWYEDDGHQDNDMGAYYHHQHNGTFSNYESATGNLTASITYSAITSNSLPPYYKVIFIKSSSYNLIPTNGMILNSATSRTGLSFHTASANRFLVGAGTGENAGGTGGTLRHTHSITHTHSGVSHAHYAQTLKAHRTVHLDLNDHSQQHAVADHYHRVTTPATTLYSNSYSATYTSSADVQPAYRTLNAFKASSTQVPKPGDIAMWLGTLATIPLGWKLCDGTDGTPDMRSRFLKIPSSASSTTTGGSNTHSHSASDSHTHTATGSHTHGTGWRIYMGLIPYRPEYWVAVGTGVGSNKPAHVNHEHYVTSCSSVTASWGSTTVSANSSDNQPPYRTVAYIQMDFYTYGGSIMQAIL